MANTDPTMPMGRSVLPMPPAMGSLEGHLAMPMPNSTPPAALPPAALPTPVQPAPVPGGGPFPPPGAKPFWQVKQQPDGSSINYIPGQTGDGSDDIILSVNQAPKIPTALQPKAPTAQ